jgi:DNA polymerase III epsilon subunit-like protein
MRALLFLDTETTGLDTGKDRVVQLSTRLVSASGTQDYDQLVRPENFAIPAAAVKIHGITEQVATLRGVSIARVLEEFSTQLEQADIIVGHNVKYDIAIIIAEAKRNGYHDLVATLTHPRFGLNAGVRAAICTQRLAADYLLAIGEDPSRSNTKLTTIYHQLFGEELTGAHDALVDAIACQRIYNFLSAFQTKQGVHFPSDILCFED